MKEQQSTIISIWYHEYYMEVRQSILFSFFIFIFSKSFVLVIDNILLVENLGALRNTKIFEYVWYNIFAWMNFACGLLKYHLLLVTIKADIWVAWGWHLSIAYS